MKVQSRSSSEGSGPVVPVGALGAVCVAPAVGSTALAGVASGSLALPAGLVDASDARLVEALVGTIAGTLVSAGTSTAGSVAVDTRGNDCSSVATVAVDADSNNGCCTLPEHAIAITSNDQLTVTGPPDVG
jgi:hypothetical protein